MAGKTGLSVRRIYERLQSIIAEWAKKQEDLLNIFDGSDVSADIIFTACYHDARRTLESIQLAQNRVTAKGWVQNLRDFGATDHGSSYDVVAEILALRAALESVQSASITALGGVDANGFVTQPYCKLASVGPFFAQIESASYADIVTALNSMTFDVS